MNLIATPRLRLRQWREEDRPLFAAMTADAQVMKYFASPLNRSQSDEVVDRCSASINQLGFGFWAAETIQQEQFIGFIGLHQVASDLPFYPAVEIGWRLGKEFWGNGYATEGAVASLRFAFEELKVPEVVSMTPTSNHPSENVMKKIGMQNTGENFKHPALSSGHELEEHLFYKITLSAWQEQNG